SHLSISHPVVSKTISDLQRTLGGTLVRSQFSGRRANELWARAARVRRNRIRRDAPGLKTDRVPRRSRFRGAANRVPRHHYGGAVAGDWGTVFATLSRHTVARASGQYWDASIPGVARAEHRVVNRENAAAIRRRRSDH